MSEHLPQEQIVAITARVRPDAQERVLREMGYIVLGRNPEGKVQCLATHPMDPSLKAANDRGDVVRLNLGTPKTH
jgi:hypothetical protein